jgi:arylsulfatase A-like enzyme
MIRASRPAPGAHLVRRSLAPFASLVAALALCACSPDGGAPPDGGPEDPVAAPRDTTPDGPLPNIVVYLIDTLRADRMSLYGYERQTTPVLDGIAEDGLVFDLAMSQAPWTLPSTVSLFTSTYPTSHGVVSGSHKVDPSVETLVEFMQGLGYHTMGFITNGLGGTGGGLDQGYDEFFQRPLIADMTDEMRARGLHTLRPLLDMIDGYDGDKPIFLYVHAIEPHSPYQGTPQGAEPFHTVDADTVDRLNKIIFDYRGLLLRRNSGEPREGDAEAFPLLEAEIMPLLDEVAALYDGDVLRADLAVGRMLGMLRYKKRWDDTAFFLVSDHGEEFLDHDLLGHDQSLYRELVRVPMMARVPGLTDGGGRVAEPVQVMDLAPTLADLLGVDPLPFWQGRSLMPLLRGEPSVEAPALAMRENVDRPQKGWRGDRETAYVQGGWKLIVHHDTDRVSLFDLTADPEEQRDRSEQEPDRAAAMRRDALALLRGLPKLPIRAKGEGMTDEKLKQLAELGYLEKKDD